MIKQSILTKTEKEVIERKLNNQKLSKQDSYYLSVSIRPKLKQIEEIVKNNILKRLEYNQKSVAIERKIKSLILGEIKDVNSIILYGSAILTNYSKYKDIDLLVLVNNKTWKTNWQKIDLLNSLEKKGKEIGLELDIQILDVQTFNESYSSSISLIYQMKDSKVIYGKLSLPKRTELSKINLRMKLDWSEPDTLKPSGEEIYNCIRNTLLVRLVMKKLVDNFCLSNYLMEELGNNLMIRLKTNEATSIERKMAIGYLNRINEDTLNQISEAKWEKIVI